MSGAGASGELPFRVTGDGAVPAEHLGRAGRGRCEIRAELDRAARAGRRELDDPEAIIDREVGVEPPSETPVELLRAVDIRDRVISSFRSTLLMLNGPSRLVGADLRWAHPGLHPLVAP